MEKLWSVTKSLRSIKGIVKKPKMSPNFFARWKDKLYFTLVNEGGDSTLIYEYDPKTGDGTDLYEEGGIIWPAPMVDGKLYFCSGRSYRCFDMGSKSLVLDYEALDYIDGDTRSDPVIAGEDIYFGIAGALICAEKETATLQWKLELGVNYMGRFCMSGEHFIVHDYNKTAYYVNKQGKILWQSEMVCKHACGYGDNVVLLDENKVYLLDGGTGKLLSVAEVEDELFRIMAVEDGIVCDTYKFAIKNDGIQQAWQVKRKGSYIVDQVLYDGKILFLDDKKNFYMVDAQSGGMETQKLELVGKQPRRLFMEDSKLYVFGQNVELDCFQL